MAVINRRKKKDGTFTYQVRIRKKGRYSTKTFFNEDTATSYAYFKESLMNDMESFDVGLEQTLSLDEAFDLKIEEIEPTKIREVKDYQSSQKQVREYFSTYLVNTTLSRMTLEHWKDLSLYLKNKTVYRGAKTESAARKMSVGTLKKLLAHCSSAINNVRKKGIKVENHPQFLIGTFLKTLT